MNYEADILIVGAGVAGLAAARELSRANFKVIILEARDRIGGRIYPEHARGLPSAIELGAEFVHGRPREILEIAERTHVHLDSVPNSHWYFHDGVIAKSDQFWSKLEQVMEQLKRVEGPDESFREFISSYGREHELGSAAAIATLYVEGFQAARAERISVEGLNKTNEAAAQVDDEKQFRIPSGYDAITQSLYDDAIAQGAEFQLNTVVEAVRWTQNNVELACRGASGEKLYKSRSVIITLPLGVLQAGEGAVGAVRFVPEVIEKRVAAHKLAPGAAVKILMRFRERFWEALSIPTQDGSAIRMDDLAFIHAPEELVPTWWTLLPQRAPILVGWAGGSRAELLQVEGQDLILQHALNALTRIFGIQREQIEDLLEEFYFHDWQRDPFSRGAYSYIPVGGLDAQAELAEPIANTLFFAGEASNTEGHHGTVHGAIATGLRAAREIIASNT